MKFLYWKYSNFYWITQFRTSTKCTGRRQSRADSSIMSNSRGSWSTVPKRRTSSRTSSSGGERKTTCSEAFFYEIWNTEHAHGGFPVPSNVIASLKISKKFSYGEDVKACQSANYTKLHRYFVRVSRRLNKISGYLAALRMTEMAITYVPSS